MVGENLSKEAGKAPWSIGLNGKPSRRQRIPPLPGRFGRCADRVQETEIRWKHGRNVRPKLDWKQSGLGPFCFIGKSIL